MIIKAMALIGSIWLICAGIANASQAPVVQVDAKFQQQAVGPALELFADPKGELTVEQLLAREEMLAFEPVSGDVPNMGYTDTTFWVRFAVHNVSDSPFRGVLEVAYAPLDEIRFYDVMDGAIVEKSAGDSLPFSVRHLEYFRAAFLLELEPKQQRRFYLRVSTSSSMQIPLLLWSQKAFVSNASSAFLFWGLYFGALLVAAGYNLFLFLSLKDKVYGLYVAFVISVGLFQACVQGLSSQYLWPEYPALTNPILLITLNAMGVAAAPFSIVFLRLRDFLPLAEKLLLGICSVMALNILVGWLLPYALVIKVSVVLFACGSLLLIFSGTYCWLKGYKPARIYLVSWVIMLLGAFVFSLKTIGLIEPTPFSNYAVTVGSALEIFLLSLAIADRVSLERAERRRAQEQNLQMQQELLDANKLALENAQASDRMKQEFLSTMSHELRTPLNGILGCAQILDRQDISDDDKHTVGYLKSSANQMLAQVNRLLNFSQLHTGRLTLEKVTFRLNDLLDEIDRFYGPLCKERDLSFRCAKVAEDVFIRSDRAKIALILGDLLDNAIKFTNHGSVSVAVSIDEEQDQCLEEGGRWLHISVQDTGQGIASDYQKSLFSMFSQQDTSYQRAHEGMGIGLAICERYSALMGGKIRFESKPGEGTLFYLDIPVTLVREDVSHVLSADVDVDISGKRVLVVEDNPTNQMIITKMLKNFGCHSELAVNGEQAVVTLQQSGPFDLVLMDCHMPVMDGFTATRAIRSLPDEVAEVPIIAVTANAADGDRDRCLASGMDDYLAKPYTQADLRRKIQAFVGR